MVTLKYLFLKVHSSLFIRWWLHCLYVKMCDCVLDIARWKNQTLDGAWLLSWGGSSTTAGTGVQSREWKRRRSLLGRKMELFWSATVPTTTTYSASAFGRTAERCTHGSSIVKVRSACTRSPAPMATSPLWNSSSGQSTIRRPEFSATHELVLSGLLRFLCVWHVRCRGLRRSEPCSISVALLFASILESITFSVCLCRRQSKAGLRNVRTDGNCLEWLITFWCCDTLSVYFVDRHCFCMLVILHPATHLRTCFTWNMRIILLGHISVVVVHRPVNVGIIQKLFFLTF